jgi:hypothetical protein
MPAGDHFRNNSGTYQNITNTKHTRRAAIKDPQRMCEYKKIAATMHKYKAAKRKGLSLSSAQPRGWRGGASCSVIWELETRLDSDGRR